MAGNLAEWVYDYYNAEYYQVAPDGGWVNPQGPDDDLYRNARGGSYLFGISKLRASDRARYNPTTYQRHVGFRCAKSVSPLGED